MNRDILYLTYILDCISKIESYIIDGKESFLIDTKTQDAVLRNLHTLSESSMKISPELQIKYKDVAWREIAAFRNVVVHDYLGLELEQVWEIIVKDIPVLKEQIQIIANR